MINHFKKGDRVIRFQNSTSMVLGRKCTVSKVKGDGSIWIWIEGDAAFYLAKNFKPLIRCNVGEQL